MPKINTPSPVKLVNVFGVNAEPTSSNQAVGDCPFCGKESHFYLNVETGQYDCKVCGESGNAITFIRKVHAKTLEATTDADYRRLKSERGYSLQTSKRFGLAWHQDNGEWLLPFMSRDKKVNNLVRYLPATATQKAVKLNLPGLSVCLFGFHQFDAEANLPILLCEGPWDAILLDQHLRDGKCRNRYNILAVPGATTFKEEWADHFRGVKVKLLFDNDDAGRKGQVRVAKIIGPVAKEVVSLVWPETYPSGCDVSELIRDGLGIINFAKEHGVKVEAGSRRLMFVRGDQIAEEPVSWLWPGHLQFGTFVSFSGLMGTHKSGIVRDLVARCTSGDTMPLSDSSLPPFNVLYLTSEDAGSQIRDLVEIAGGDLTYLHVHDIASTLDPIDFLDCLDEFEATINSMNARLVVFDALNSFVGGDISTDAKARRTLSGRLQSLARRTGACVIGIRNWGRSDVGTSSQRAMGAASLSDVGRCVLNTRELAPLEKDGPKRFQLEFEKVSNAPQPLPIPYDVEDLSDGLPEHSHLRRIVWRPIDRAAWMEALEKVAKKGSDAEPTHLRVAADREGKGK